MTAPQLLILGGTHFVGRSIVDSAIRHGWDVTAVHRGLSPYPLTGAVKHLIVDRTDTSALTQALQDHRPSGDGWDAVVDTWSGQAWVVDAAAQILSSQAQRYLYVSSRSVYDAPQRGATETWPRVVGDSHTTSYAQAKSCSEDAVMASWGHRSIIVRPGVIIGPWEDVGRLPWWLGRIARGGPILAPGPADAGIQVIDVRDLADFVMKQLNDSAHGTEPTAYDLASPAGSVTMGELLKVCLDVTQSSGHLHWALPEYIISAGVIPWTEVPLWVPMGPEHEGLYHSDVSKALAAGLTCRPIADTVRDTWHWMQSIDELPQRTDRPPLGLDSHREAGILATLSDVAPQYSMS